MVNGYSNLGADKLYLDEDRFEPFWTTRNWRARRGVSRPRR